MAEAAQPSRVPVCVCKRVCVCVCLCVCVRVCVCACLRVSTYMYICMYINIGGAPLQDIRPKLIPLSEAAVRTGQGSGCSLDHPRM
jgi:hypothetical protein